MNIPIYRAKKIDSDEHIEFESFYKYDNKYYAITRIINQTVDSWFTNVQIPLTQKIEPTTIAIHFPDMLDSQGNKIFASLSEDGKGGDLVISKTYPFYGDAPEITDSSGKCEELNYKGLICFTSTGFCLEYIKVSDRVRGGAIGYQIEDFNEYEVIGIKE